MDTINLWIWRCLVIYKRLAPGKKIRHKKETVRPSYIQRVNTMVITIWKKGTWGPLNLLILKALQDTTMWISCCMYQRRTGERMRLVYGKIQHKNNLYTKSMGLLGDHCLFVTKWMCFVSDGNVRGVSRHLRETRTWQYILRRKDVLEEKQKSSVQEVNLSTS